jgi:HSP20 family molecular chaperone IbpA
MQIKIEVERVLTIRAEHSGEDEQEREGWYLRERFAGTVGASPPGKGRT